MTGTQVRDTAVYTMLDPKISAEREAAVKAFTPHLPNGATPEGIDRELRRRSGEEVVIVSPDGYPNMASRKRYADSFEPANNGPAWVGAEQRAKIIEQHREAFGTSLDESPQAAELENIIQGHCNLMEGDFPAAAAAILDAGYRKS